ncbi:MAG: hypothetical protein V3T88_02805 [Nitrosomonadaceae bacterium]
MPIVEVEGQRFDFAEGTPDDVIGNAIRQHFAAQVPSADGRIDIGAELQRGEEQAAARREAAAAAASGLIAEPIAGVTGIGAMLRGAGPEVAEQEVAQVREALTFQPPTEAGREALRGVGEVLQPVGEALQEVRTATGDLAFEVTGSPALAAIATTLPDAALEVLGLGVGKRAAQVGTGLKAAPVRIKDPTKISEKAITKSLLEAAPEVEQIKDASRAIYKEIDDLQVTLKPGAADSLMRKVIGRARRENVDAVLTPKSARVVQRFTESIGTPQARSMTQIDQLRQQAQIAASNVTDPSDARLGAIMVDEIDDFLDKVPKGAFTGPDAKTAAQVSERYKAARGLWGRARRAELISEAFQKAELTREGFEGGIRNQLRSIVNNKKRSRFFTKDEISAMRDVIKGSTDANILKLVGRIGFSEGSATNILGGLAGLATFGPIGSLIGQFSRKFAQNATEKAARQMEVLIRGGAKGGEIAKTYLQNVKKGKRNIEDLSDMLLASGTELDEILKSSNKFVKESAEITRARKLFEVSEAVGAAAPVAVQQEQQP